MSSEKASSEKSILPAAAAAPVALVVAPKSAETQIRELIALLKKGVSTKENRLINRALKLSSVRHLLTGELLATFAAEFCPPALQYLQDFVQLVVNPPKVEEPLLPEVQVFVHHLVTLYFLDRHNHAVAFEVSSSLVNFLHAHNRRTLDLLSSLVYFYFSLAAEKLSKLSSIRNQLLLAHRSATLQHNEPGQVTLTNCILRNFLSYNLYDQADKFRSHVELPEARSNHEHARYLFYVGQLYAVQLHYSEAFDNLRQAIQKAPQKSGKGFQQISHKLLVVVQLLMGEIPERSLFRNKFLRRSLIPYYQLTQAVRNGNLVAFGSVIDQFKANFVRDGVMSLIIRLRRNVIKTGLRRISLAYSRISMKDICEKLQFDNEEDVEFIVAKGIKDGVIEASINRSQHFMFSKDHADVYSTNEPLDSFHKRIELANEIHSCAVKAMRYSPDAHKPAALKDAEELDSADPFDPIGAGHGDEDDD